MAAPSAILYHRDGGPVQRTLGYATFTTAATDVYSSDGISLASGVFTLTLGYNPTHVMITNATTRIMTEWFPPIASGTSIDTAAAGTRTLNTSSKITVDGTTGDPSALGVIVLTLSGFATDGDTIIWEIQG